VRSNPYEDSWRTTGHYWTPVYYFSGTFDGFSY